MDTTIIQLIIQYGPEAVTAIENLVKQLESSGTLTIADVQSEFAPLKPYSAYNIQVIPATA